MAAQPGLTQGDPARFHADKQICVATEAAGEGINLQFCHLMINYDLPWNPVRLEQRMGRIHRIGQEPDVWVFNFCATNTDRGPAARRLHEKLEEMRTALGGRVYDVIGEMLDVNELDFERLVKDTLANPSGAMRSLERSAGCRPRRFRVRARRRDCPGHPEHRPLWVRAVATGRPRSAG